MDSPDQQEGASPEARYAEVSSKTERWLAKNDKTLGSRSESERLRDADGNIYEVRYGGNPVMRKLGMWRDTDDGKTREEWQLMEGGVDPGGKTFLDYKKFERLATPDDPFFGWTSVEFSNYDTGKVKGYAPEGQQPTDVFQAFDSLLDKLDTAKKV